MLRTLPKRALVLIAAAALLPWAGVMTGAQAGHLGPQPLGIMQDGDGRGNSAPMSIEGSTDRLDNYFQRTVLFHGNRFPLPNGQTQRPGFRKYASWGTVTLDTGEHQLAFTTADDGQNWTRPKLATIEDPETGEDIPFIIGNISHVRQFAVGFSTLSMAPSGNPAGNLQFAIYYMRHDPAAVPAGSDIYDITNFRRALSDDGVTWVDNPCIPGDCHIRQGGAPVGLISGFGAGTIKDGSYGPTDIKFLPSGLTTVTCGSDDPAGPPPPSPWNCRWVMIYDMVSSTGLEQTGIAWSGDGITWFNNIPAPIIPVGPAGAWDDNYATMTHVLQVSTHDYIAYYSGGRLPASACYDGLRPCFSLGTAYSSDGITFTKAGENPVTPNVLTSAFLPNPPHSLWHAQAAGDAGGGFKKVFYSVLDNGLPATGFQAEEYAMLARQAFFPPAPGLNIRIDNPTPNSTNPVETTLTVYVADDSGINIGPDPLSFSASFKNLDTLVVTPITGLVRNQSLVGSFRRPGFKVTRANVWSLIPDGKYELTFTAKDLDGNTLSKTVTFFLDRTAPNTIVTAEPVTPAVVLPGGSIATVEGTSTDSTSPLLGVRAIVTNPLMMKKSYEVNFLAGQPSNPPMGFSNMTLSTDGKSLSWRWIAPGLDPHTILPGPYTISFIAFDTNRNTENVDSINTVEVFVV